MATKRTGVMEIIESEICETVCDICFKTIKDNDYPKIEIEIAHSEYIADGDQPLRYDVCSSKCFVKLAETLKIK